MLESYISEILYSGQWHSSQPRRQIDPAAARLGAMPIRLLAVALLAAVAAQAPLSPPAFDYDTTKLIDVQITEGTGASVKQLTYAKLDGARNPATLVTQPSAGEQGRPPQPAVLFVHWYEPPRPTSNRTEFLAEAVELASSGVTSLLIDTPWTAERWFPTRDGEK